MFYKFVTYNFVAAVERICEMKYVSASLLSVVSINCNRITYSNRLRHVCYDVPFFTAHPGMHTLYI